MKINFLDDLLTLLASSGMTPEQYMIERSLFFSKEVVDIAFDEMESKLNAGDALFIRKSTKQGSLSPYRKVNGKYYWNNIYSSKSLDNIEVRFYKDGNREVRRIINSITGVVVSQGSKSDILFGKISHIWGETSNPFFFTGLWNIVIVPAYFNDILDKEGSTDPRIEMIIEQYKAVCWDKYDIQGKLLKLGLTSTDIKKYEPKHRIAYSYKYQEISKAQTVQKKHSGAGTSKKQFSVNGKQCRTYGEVVLEAVKIYASKNPHLTAAQIAAAWAPVQVVSNQVETDTDHAARRQRANDPKFDKRSSEVQLANGESVFVSNQFTFNNVIALAKKVNAQWGITIA